VIPDTYGLLGQVDDVLIMRMTMAFALERVPGRADHYRERHVEVFETLSDDLGAARGYLGDVYPWLEGQLGRMPAIEFKGKRASGLLDDLDGGTWLYGVMAEAMLDLEFDDDELHRELRKIDRILPVMQEKMGATRR
jgi:hypothetical protein